MMKAVTFAVVMMTLWIAADATNLLAETPKVVPAAPVLSTVPSLPPGHNIRFCLRDGEVKPCLEGSTQGEIAVPAQPLPQEKIVLDAYYPYGHLYGYRYVNPLGHYAYAPAPYLTPSGHGIPLINYPVPEYAIPTPVEATVIL